MMRRAATLLSMLSMLKCVDSMRIVRPAISRRPFFAAATAAALAASPVAAQGGLSAGALAQAGMEAFRENRVAESIDLFDAAEARNPKYRTRLWQRGLSYYYAGNFAAAAEQFKAENSAILSRLEAMEKQLQGRGGAGGAVPLGDSNSKLNSSA